MSTWGDGYVDDGSYVSGFYREQTPNLLALLALTKGQQAPDPNTRLTYCELGSGLGLTLNLLAAANPQIEFYGNDFNPSHILESRALANEAGSDNVHFFEQSFEEFIDEPSLPPAFDLIALHGIYSWVSPKNRAHIVEFIRRKLAPGGLLYISYNALPAWSAQMPLQRLLIGHAATQSGPMVGRVQSAVEFAEKLKQADAAYFRHTPHAAQRLTATLKARHAYVAHEYLNQDWTPFYHADVIKELASAKVSYLGSAALLENNDGMFLPPEVIEILKSIKDPTFRETVRDYSAYPLFRRDVFIRGSLPIPSGAIEAQWLDRSFAIISPRDDIPMEVRGIPRNVHLRAEVYGPILDELAREPMTVRQLLAHPTIKDFGIQRVVQALGTLAGMGHVHLCLDQVDLEARTKRTNAFNRAVFERARLSGEIQCVASPIIAGGVAMTQIPMLILLGLQKQPSQMPKFVNDALRAQGLRMQKDGKPLETEEESFAEIQAGAARLQSKLIPLWRQLKII